MYSIAQDALFYAIKLYLLQKLCSLALYVCVSWSSLVILTV